MRLPKLSIGIGDRFGRQGEAQLKAFCMAKDNGIDIAPVWNKSFREHEIVGTTPNSVRAEADAAVNALGWQSVYFIDADHINLNTVDRFIESSDFFTLDVADAIGESVDSAEIQSFVQTHQSMIGNLNIPGLPAPIKITADFLEEAAGKYLYAIQEAGRIYRHIKMNKSGEFITEVSMDETNCPQTPEELLIILAAIKEEGIPAQTIAPKFSGRFNKGVDYVGDPDQFEQEFESDLAVIRHAIRQFGLPDNLKLSVHSGSDKFKLYPLIRKAISKYDAGVHLKTAGTTWLEELIGLAESQGEGLKIAKLIYKRAYGRYDELCKPYATVIDIDFHQLPVPEKVVQWSGTEYADALRHNQSHPDYNLHFRQLLHVGYKIAAEMGKDYLDALEHNREIVHRHVAENIYERHIKPLFL